MEYSDAMAFLEEARTKGSRPGLTAIGQLLKEIGSPQDKISFVHVAGTNGKGSVSTDIAYILAAAGYRTGRFSSPAVFHNEEMIQLLTRGREVTEISNGKSITDRKHEKESTNQEDNDNSNRNDTLIQVISIKEQELTSCLEEIREACYRMVRKGQEHPTVFEVETAMAFLYFCKQSCDIAVLEVGMGGSLDATNIITTAKCAVLTSISMDHMEYLGNTLGEIAGHKAGIIKAGIPVVSYEQEKEAEAVIRQTCIAKGAALTIADFNKVSIRKTDRDGTVFDYEDLKRISLKLLGMNQVYNAITAILAARTLQDNGFSIDGEDILLGLKEASWPGRFEIICNKPLIVLDGAHNEGAGQVLAENIRTYLMDKQIYFIMGVFKDKDYDALIRHTCLYARKIYCITPPGPRGLNSDKLAETAISLGAAAEDAGTAKEAFLRIDEEIRKSGRDKEEYAILAFGSLSILKEIREGAYSCYGRT